MQSIKRACHSVLTWIILTYSVALAVTALWAPALWPVALMGFVQNIAFTFVSRGRNSGSLTYHMIAAIFSNGIYAALLFISIDVIAQAKTMPALFLLVYTMTTLSGSIFAHWLALRIEKGKGRTVQDDKFRKLADRVDLLQSEIDATRGLMYYRECRIDGALVRVFSAVEFSDEADHAINELAFNESLRRKSNQEVVEYIAGATLADEVILTTGPEGQRRGLVLRV